MSERDFQHNSSPVSFQDRTGTITNRDILANAVGQTEVERTALTDYLKTVERSKCHSQMLAEINRKIDELAASDTPRDDIKIRDLEAKAAIIRSTRDIVEIRLQKMEKGVLAPLIEREKEIALKKLYGGRRALRINYRSNSSSINQIIETPKKAANIHAPETKAVLPEYSEKNPFAKILLPVLGIFLLIFLVTAFSEDGSGSHSYNSQYHANSYNQYNTTYSTLPTFDFSEIETFDPSAFEGLFEDTSTQTTQIAPTFPVPATEAASLEIISWPEVTRRNEDVKVKIKGEPYTKYYITVYYSSGPSTADGLEPKFSNSEGYVVWEWHVGGKTNPGTFSITVSGGDETETVSFRVTT